MKSIVHLGTRVGDDLKLMPSCGDKVRKGEVLLDPSNKDSQSQFKEADGDKRICRHCKHTVKAQSEAFSHGMVEGMKLVMSKLQQVANERSGLTMEAPMNGSNMNH